MEPATLETIDRFYHHDEGLHFLTVPTDIDRACELVASIGPYDNFVPRNVIMALKDINRLAVAHNQVVTYQIGREYSPVVYINGLDYSNMLVGHLYIENILASFGGADEINVEIGKIRAWWD